MPTPPSPAKSDGETLPRIVALMQDSEGKLLATSVTFQPITAIQPSDIFTNGTINWAARDTYPHVGGKPNEIWSCQATKGDRLISIWLVDYLLWNAPISPRMEKGKPVLRNLCGVYPYSDHNRMLYDLGVPIKDSQVTTNYKVAVPASNFGFDKVLIYKSTPVGRCVDLTQSVSELANSTSIYLGFVNLETRRIFRLPFPNIHEQGKICIIPTASASSLSHLPNAVFSELSHSPGNLDLANDTLLQKVYYVPIPETEDDNGDPWLEARSNEKIDLPGLALNLPDFWDRFSPLIKKYLASKEKKPASKK